MPLTKHRAFTTSLAAVALAACLVSPAAALAADPPSPCGETSKEAIAAAEKALALKDGTSQAIALQCLLQAVKELDAIMPVRRSYDKQPSH